jgi:Acetyltransferase (GNAT) family
MIILLRKLKRNLSDYGIWITAAKLLRYIIKPIYEKQTYIIFFNELDQFIYHSFSNDNFTYKFINANDAEIINQIEGREEWLRNKLMDKLNKDCICLVALFDKKVVGFLLVNLNEFYIPLIHLKRSLRSNECFGDQITIDKIYRGTGLVSSLRIRMFKELRKRGIKKIYGGTHISNIATRKSVNKAGYKYLTDALFFKFLKCKGTRFRRIRNHIY